MGRLTSAHATAMGAEEILPALFAEFIFEDDDLTSRFWSGESDTTWNSQTWTGGALFAGVEMSGEGTELKARSFVFTVNGVSRSFYSVAVDRQYRNRPVRLWFNLMDATGLNVVHSYQLEEARMDTMEIKQNSDTLTVVLTAESLLLNLFTPNRYFMTSRDHKRIHPTDNFYRYVPDMPGVRLPWGLESAQGSTNGVGNSYAKQLISRRTQP